MNCCPNDDDPPARSRAPRPTVPASRFRRLGALIQWALPITALALIPKCPGCVAAYVLLLTGIGLSLPAAATLRWTVIAVCAVGLAYLLFRAARRALAPAA